MSELLYWVWEPASSGLQSWWLEAVLRPAQAVKEALERVPFDLFLAVAAKGRFAFALGHFHAPPEEVVVTPPKGAADLYRSALDSFTQENFQGAVLEFEEFVANHSDHDLADNAQYWIGECYYAQKKFEQAVIEFGRVEKYYSAGNKAPAALLKKGLALKELDRDQEARAVLEDVISKYPASDEAGVSGKRLSQWR